MTVERSWGTEIGWQNDDLLSGTVLQSYLAEDEKRKVDADQVWGSGKRVKLSRREESGESTAVRV